ncbi:MAG TPA: Hsp20/alpha crystallin family protein, partial [Nitrospiraceae bacterium]|nr:Hsp20/alpha crystallin family protein [Nitrospiraceae bacterium]
MDDMFSRLPSLFGRLPLPGEQSMEWAPSVDISETEKEYLIRATLPAVKKEDVVVSVDSGILSLSGERRQKEEQKSEKSHKVESFYGSFARSFALPDGIDASAISAESKDGVLTIHVPKTKTEPKKATTIKVQ